MSLTCIFIREDTLSPSLKPELQGRYQTWHSWTTAGRATLRMDLRTCSTAFCHSHVTDSPICSTSCLGRCKPAVQEQWMTFSKSSTRSALGIIRHSIQLSEQGFRWAGSIFFLLHPSIILPLGARVFAAREGTPQGNSSAGTLYPPGILPRCGATLLHNHSLSYSSLQLTHCSHTHIHTHRASLELLLFLRNKKYTLSYIFTERCVRTQILKQYWSQTQKINFI